MCLFCHMFLHHQELPAPGSYVDPKPFRKADSSITVSYEILQGIVPLLLFIQQQPAASHLQPLCLPRQVLGHKPLSPQRVTHLCFGPLCASGLSLQELPKAMKTLVRLQARSHLSHLCGRYLSSRARSSRRAGGHDQCRAQERSAWTWGGHGQALGSWAEAPRPPVASTVGGLGPWAARGTAMGLG